MSLSSLNQNENILEFSFNLSRFNLLYSSLGLHICHKLKSHISSSKTSCASHNEFHRIPRAFCTPPPPHTHTPAQLKSISISQNLCFCTTSIYYVCLFKIYSSKIIKYTIMTLELYLSLGPICAGQTLSISLYSIKDQKPGMLSPLSITSLSSLSFL